MSDDTQNGDETPQGGRVGEMLKKMDRLREWASGHWLRNLSILAVLFALFSGTIGGWVYMSSLAVDEQLATLQDALDAWDDRDADRVKDVIRELQRNPGLEEVGLGGPLFVLGAVKTMDAERQVSEARRQAEYLVASRYLQESYVYGFPPGREGEGLSLLGLSLVASHQYIDGIAALNDALEVDLPSPTPIHRLLAMAHFSAPTADYSAADEHLGRVLEDPQLTPEERADALLLRAEVLAADRKFSQARAALDEVPAGSQRQRWVELLRVQVTLDEAALQFAQAKSAQESPPSELVETVTQALETLDRPVEKENKSGRSDQREMYLRGRALELLGDREAALAQYAATRAAYAGLVEGTAAALSEAELLQLSGRHAEALIAFRRILEQVEDPASFQNSLVPIARLKQRVSESLARWTDQERWDEAMALIAELNLLFDPIQIAELRATTLEAWGEAELKLAHGQSEDDLDRLRAGRRHLREAGTAYQRLADLRFATNLYTTDLWNSAEAFYRGQSFTHTVRVLDEYLRQEPEARNPTALLRLGQAHLALGEIPACIESLNECIDFHPRDAATYQARIDCAKAYSIQGDLTEAEALLRANLTGSALSPKSPEWRDSLFALGSLLHDRGAHDEAIFHLEQAVERYPDAKQALLARYLMAESHRLAAQVPLATYRASITPSDREKNRRLAETHLLAALDNYETVQREITLSRADRFGDEAAMNMLRNCHMLQGSVLFDLERFEDALLAYSAVAALYQDDPFVLETLVQIANCWRRLNRGEKARGAIKQAQQTLNRLPVDADFLASSNFSREQWQQLLDEMGKW